MDSDAPQMTRLVPIEVLNMKIIATALTALISLALPARTLVTLGDVEKFQSSELATGKTCRVTAEITHRSALRPNVYVISAIDGIGSPGVVVVAPEGCAANEGDVVNIEGAVETIDCHAAIRADRMDTARHFDLGEAPACKAADFRKGALHARRISVTGRIHPRTCHYDAKSGITTLIISYERSKIFARVPGEIDIAAFSHRDARAEGCVFNTYNADGSLAEVTLELASAGDLIPLEPEERDMRTPAIYALSFILAILFGVLGRIALKIHREKIANAAVAKERRRIADEFHDTIEQHLAAAKLYLSGIQESPELTENARAALKTVEKVLVHAKDETSAAVKRLRGEDAS